MQFMFLNNMNNFIDMEVMEQTGGMLCLMGVKNGIKNKYKCGFIICSEIVR
jgi:hypothetical protein